HLIAYAEQRLKREGRWEDTHRRLLHSWGDLASPPDDYAWRWTPYHLATAGDTDRLRRLLLEYKSMAARLKRRGIHALIDDLNYLSADKDAKEIQRVVGQGGHILVHGPGLLSEQLLARLIGPDAGGSALLAQARQ